MKTIAEELAELQESTTAYIARLHKLRALRDSGLFQLIKTLESQLQTLLGLVGSKSPAAEGFIAAVKARSIEKEVIQFETREQEELRLIAQAPDDKALYLRICDPEMTPTDRIRAVRSTRFNPSALKELEPHQKNIILEAYRDALRPRFDAFSGPRILDITEFDLYAPSPPPVGLLEVIDILGQGADGKVYLVKDQNHRLFAAKERLQNTYVAPGSATEVTYFETTQKNAGYSPHLVECFGKRRVEHQDGSHFFGVITAYRRRTMRLDSFMQELNRASEKMQIAEGQKAIVVESIYVQLLRLARHFHTGGIINHDLTPSNLLIDMVSGVLCGLDLERSEFAAITPKWKDEPQNSNSPYVDISKEDARVIYTFLRTSGLLSNAGRAADEFNDGTSVSVDTKHRLNELKTQINTLETKQMQDDAIFQLVEKEQLDLTSAALRQQLGVNPTDTQIVILDKFNDAKSQGRLPASSNETPEAADSRRRAYELDKTRLQKSLVALRNSQTRFLRQFAFSAIDGAALRAVENAVMENHLGHMKTRVLSLDREYELESTSETEVASIVQRVCQVMRPDIAPTPSPDAVSIAFHQSLSAGELHTSLLRELERATTRDADDSSASQTTTSTEKRTREKYDGLAPELILLLQRIEQFERANEPNRKRWEALAQHTVESIAEIDLVSLPAGGRLNSAVTPILHLEKFKRLRLLRKYAEDPTTLTLDIKALEEFGAYLKGDISLPLKKREKLSKSVSDELNTLTGYLANKARLSYDLETLEKLHLNLRDLTKVDKALTDLHKEKINQKIDALMAEFLRPSGVENQHQNANPLILLNELYKWGVPKERANAWKKHVEPLIARLSHQYPNTLNALRLEEATLLDTVHKKTISTDVETMTEPRLDVLKVRDLLLWQANRQRLLAPIHLLQEVKDICTSRLLELRAWRSLRTETVSPDDVKALSNKYEALLQQTDRTLKEFMSSEPPAASVNAIINETQQQKRLLDNQMRVFYSVQWKNWEAEKLLPSVPDSIEALKNDLDCLPQTLHHSDLETLREFLQTLRISEDWPSFQMTAKECSKALCSTLDAIEQASKRDFVSPSLVKNISSTLNELFELRNRAFADVRQYEHLSSKIENDATISNQLRDLREVRAVIHQALDDMKNAKETFVHQENQIRYLLLPESSTANAVTEMRNEMCLLTSDSLQKMPKTKLMEVHDSIQKWKKTCQLAAREMVDRLNQDIQRCRDNLEQAANIPANELQQLQKEVEQIAGALARYQQQVAIPRDGDFPFLPKEVSHLVRLRNRLRFNVELRQTAPMTYPLPSNFKQKKIVERVFSKIGFTKAPLNVTSQYRPDLDINGRAKTPQIAPAVPSSPDYTAGLDNHSISLIHGRPVRPAPDGKFQVPSKSIFRVADDESVLLAYRAPGTGDETVMRISKERLEEHSHFHGRTVASIRAELVQKGKVAGFPLPAKGAAIGGPGSSKSTTLAPGKSSHRKSRL